MVFSGVTSALVVRPGLNRKMVLSAVRFKCIGRPVVARHRTSKGVDDGGKLLLILFFTCLLFF